MRKIAVITDMTMTGSGYYYILTNLLTGLAAKGYEIHVAGLGYMGEPHNYPFSVIPCPMLQDAVSIVNNLIYLKQVDMILVGMDIPIQMQLHSQLSQAAHPETKQHIPYVAITPMENGPLVEEWATGLANMDTVFFISELAKQEALNAGVKKAEHIYIGVDTNLWHTPTPEEKKQLRQGLGFEDNDLVILTVADNQERKNLWAGMRIVAELKKKLPDRKFKYIMVTKEESVVGWRLRSLAKAEGLMQEFLPFQRGIPTHDLWGLYACADIYLQPSKAEGLGLPVMEAMGCGIPVFCTDTGAMHELCADGRGYLLPVEYSFIDVWGNSKRDMVNIEKAAQTIAENLVIPDIMEPVTRAANLYVKGRTWDVAVDQMDAKIKELFNEPQQQAEAQAGSK